MKFFLTLLYLYVSAILGSLSGNVKAPPENIEEDGPRPLIQWIKEYYPALAAVCWAKYRDGPISNHPERINIIELNKLKSYLQKYHPVIHAVCSDDIYEFHGFE